MGYQKGFDFPPVDAAGGLSLWWNGMIEVNILSSSKNLIHSKLRVRGSFSRPRYLEEFIDIIELIDLGFTGPKFTWRGTRNNSLVQERLDRGLVNDPGGMRTKHMFKLEAFWCKETIERSWNLDFEGTWLNKWHRKI
ncbi:hypothetical protein ACFX10_025553 [Malus domestica]